MSLTSSDTPIDIIWHLVLQWTWVYFSCLPSAPWFRATIITVRDVLSRVTDKERPVTETNYTSNNYCPWHIILCYVWRTKKYRLSELSIQTKCSSNNNCPWCIIMWRIMDEERLAMQVYISINYGPWHVCTWHVCHGRETIGDADQAYIYSGHNYCPWHISHESRTRNDGQINM